MQSSGVWTTEDIQKFREKFRRAMGWRIKKLQDADDRVSRASDGWDHETVRFYRTEKILTAMGYNGKVTLADAVLYLSGVINIPGVRVTVGTRNVIIELIPTKKRR